MQDKTTSYKDTTQQHQQHQHHQHINHFNYEDSFKRLS